MSDDAAADIEAEVRARNGGTSKGDVKAYAAAGGAAGAAAGCAALGAPAAAPVCGQIGGYVAGAIAGALYDAFSSDDEEERAKQEARSADWHRYQRGVVDYIDAQQATLLKAVNTFLAENWELVRNARVPCYTTPWGSPRFRDWFALGREDAPDVLRTSQDVRTKIVPLLAACSPGFDTAWKDMQAAWGRVFANAVSGTFGDDTEQARKLVREQNADLFDRTGAQIKAGLAAGLQQWATSGAVYTISGGREADLEAAAARQRVREEYYAPKRTRKKGSGGVVLAVAALAGALLLARK